MKIKKTATNVKNNTVIQLHVSAELGYIQGFSAPTVENSLKYNTI